MNITELLRGTETTPNGWGEKETEIQKNFTWDVGPEEIYQMTRAEYKRE